MGQDAVALFVHPKVLLYLLAARIKIAQGMLDKQLIGYCKGAALSK
jgi:hypothetical protein